MIVDFKNVQLVWPGAEEHNQIISFRLDTELGTRLAITEEKSDFIFEGKHHVICPGFCELDAQLKEPGLENSESIQSGLDAALAGGFTAVLAGPETTPCIDNKPTVRFVISEGQDHPVNLMVKGALTSGLAKEGLSELYDMYAAGARVFGQNTQTQISTSTLLKALQYCKSFGSRVFVSANSLDLHKNGMVHEGLAHLHTGLKAIPELSETLNLDTFSELLEYTDASIHIAGISSQKGIEKIRQLKDRFPGKVSCDVPLWNLMFNESRVYDFDSNFKFFPPLRSEQDRKALIGAVTEGIIDCITTSHHPWEVEYKKVEFDLSEFGSISFQTAVAGFQKHLSKEMDITTFITALSINPRLVLGEETALFEEGNSFVCLNLEEAWTLNSGSNFSKSENTPFWNEDLKGKCVFSINKGMFALLN
ncbi:MAG: dihydroorotase [Luteibaculaceae bacterium]|jgi:dihydroorotase